MVLLQVRYVWYLGGVTLWMACGFVSDHYLKQSSKVKAPSFGLHGVVSTVGLQLQSLKEHHPKPPMTTCAVPAVICLQNKRNPLFHQHDCFPGMVGHARTERPRDTNPHTEDEKRNTFNFFTSKFTWLLMPMVIDSVVFLSSSPPGAAACSLSDMVMWWCMGTSVSWINYAACYLFLEEF